MIVLRQKEYGILDSMNQWLIKKFNPKAKPKENPKSVLASEDEIKSSIIYKLFPTIDPSTNHFISSDDLKKLKTTGLKDRNFLMKCIEKIIWSYEEETSDDTGILEKDIKGNIDVFAIDEIVDNETVIIGTCPKKNSVLSRKTSYFWDIEINLRTGEGDVCSAGR